MVRLAAVLGMLAALASAAQAEETTETEDELWALEREYHACLAKGDVDWLAKFWHADFLGWPSHEQGPVDLSNTKASVAELLAGIDVVSSEVRPLGITFWGDVALVFYEVTHVMNTADHSGVSVSYRLTHTWVKEGGRWKVLGGMSSQRSPDTSR